MAGVYSALMRFVQITTGQSFTIPYGTKTASIIPKLIGLIYSQYNVTTPAPSGDGNLPVSFNMDDTTSFPQNNVSGGWAGHVIMCVTGTVNIKYWADQIEQTS